MIPESFIQDLLARVSVEDIVGRYVQLRKGGANLLGLCPFHNEKTPSFTVSPSKQFYHCFGCGAHGSAISFLMHHTGASFPESVKTLAAEVGMVMPEATLSPAQLTAQKKARVEKSLHQNALDLAQSHYIKQLKASEDAINYLKGRGLSGEIAAQYGLGWSGGGSRALSGVLPDYESNTVLECGLVIESDDGSRYDRFRNRIMFPIRNQRGNIIGFGGRLIAEGEPKYLNSPETSLFSKGHELYGLWESRQGIRSESYVLVVEGYMDVIALAQHGLQNAVATLGTATTSAHIQKLMRVSNRIVFCFDGDNAGQRAAWRALTTCLPMLRDDVSIRFLFLPDRHDPDSYINEHGVKAFKDVVSDAQALSSVMLTKLAQEHSLEEPEGRAACVHEAAPLLNLIPASALKIQIEHEFAQRVRLTPEELTALLNSQGAQAPAQSVSQARPVPESTESTGIGNAHASVAISSSNVNAARSGAKSRQRAVMPMAKRLFRLLLAHPGLVTEMGDQQLEILEHRPQLVLVRELVTLINVSGATHIGALIEAVDPESELANVLVPLATELLSEEDLPDPYAEWKDALQRIELDAIRAEQSALIQTGLTDKALQQRYQELNRQLAIISRAGLSEKL